LNVVPEYPLCAAISAENHAEIGPFRGQFAVRPGRRRIFQRANAIDKAEETLGPARGYDHTATGGGDAVGESETRATVHELYDAYGRRDFDRLAAFLHDDIDWVIYAPVSVFAFAGPRHGRAEVLLALAGIAKDYTLESYTPEITVVDGERAAVMSDVGFRQRATDRTLRFRVANFLRFADGRLIEFREFTNTFDVVEQALGHELDL